MFDYGDPKEPSAWPYIFAAVVLLTCLIVSFPAGFAVAIVVSIIVKTVEYLRNHHKWQGAESWPRTTAIVESVDVRTIVRSRRRHDIIGELAYSYGARGSYYSGFYQCRFDTKERAWEFVNDFRGKHVPVRYKPEAPATSLMTTVELKQVTGTELSWFRGE
jgi:hypothetical protein